MSKKHKHHEKEEKLEEETLQQPQETEEDKLKDEVLEYKNKYLRVLADLENTRKRMQKEKDETIKYIIENTIAEFLPILDNFENALKFAENSSEEVQKWATGFQMILTQFKDILHNYGIIAFHSGGNLFDPHYHEALEIVETDQYPDGTIIEELAKGYKSANRTIRPARVKVAKAIASEENFKKESLKNEQ